MTSLLSHTDTTRHDTAVGEGEEDERINEKRMGEGTNDEKVSRFFLFLFSQFVGRWFSAVCRLQIRVVSCRVASRRVVNDDETSCAIFSMFFRSVGRLLHRCHRRRCNSTRHDRHDSSEL